MLFRATLIGILAVSAGFAQGPGRGPGRFGPGPGPGARFMGAQAGMPGRVVKNAPFSADMVTETTQALPDGNHIRQTSTVKVYRDSEGRTRREESLRNLSGLAANGNLPQLVFINDPVAGANYALNPGDRTATKSGWGRPGGQGNPDARPANRQPGEGAGAAIAGGFRGGRNNQNVKTESLGRQTIEGVQADGTRTTMTIPAGQIGNEQPINITQEVWYSPDLQMVVLSKHSDPRSGDTVTRVSNLTRAEPPTTLFSVPPDYKVTEGMRRGGPAPNSAKQ